MRVRTQRLPIGYRELEYIESTGTQYIDTGFVPNATTTFKCKLKSTSGYQFGCGRQEIDSSTNAFLGAYKNNNGVTIEYGAIGFGYVQPVDEISVISSKVESSTYYVVNNNGTLASRNVTTRTTAGTIIICGLHNGAQQTEVVRGQGKFYYLTFYNSGTLVHNYIPCERQSDGKPGMYDTVGQIFYVNNGTGEFNKGPYKDYYGLNYKKESNSDYIELEYIESTGTQYIQLSFGFDYTDKVEARFAMDLTSGSDKYIVSPQTWNTNNNRFAMGVHTISPDYNIDYACGYGNVNTGSCGLQPITQHDGKLHDWIYENKVYTITDLNLSKDCSEYSFGTTTTNLKLFYGYNTNSKGKLAYYRHWKNNTKVIELIPAIRKSDNAIGMLDKVNNVFYTNQGSGTFIAGPAKELPSEYQRVEYIGTQKDSYYGMDLGVKFKSNTKVIIDRIDIDGRTSDGNGNYVIGCAKSLGVEGLEIYTWANEFQFNYQTPDYINFTNLVKNKHILYEITSTSVKMTNIDTNEQIYSKNDFTSTMPSYSNISIFRNNRSGGATSVVNGACKLYKMSIYEGDVLIRDLIPCYRKSDNVVGMYDLVNRVFYTNQGSGTFLKGNNVSNTLSCKVAGGSSDVYYGYNQIVQNGKFFDNTSTYFNVANATISSVTNHRINITQKSQYTYAGLQYRYPLIKGHIYFISCDVIPEDVTRLTIGFEYTSIESFDVTLNQSNILQTIQTYNQTSGDTDFWKSIIIGNFSATNIEYHYSVTDIFAIDLTDWYGASKEPSTVAEFKQKFAKDYYGTCLTPIKLTQKMIEAEPTYGYNQLIQFIQRNNVHGITWTPTTNGIYSLSGTATNTYSSWQESLVDNHKYMVYINIPSNPNNIGLRVGLLNVSGSGTDTITSGNAYKICTYTPGSGKSFGIVYSRAGLVLDGIKIQVMLIDLTDWYTSGSEPTTIEEFKQTFPNLYYPYSKKRLLNKYMINKLIN